MSKDDKDIVDIHVGKWGIKTPAPKAPKFSKKSRTPKTWKEVLNEINNNLKVICTSLFALPAGILQLLCQLTQIELPTKETKRKAQQNNMKAVQKEEQKQAEHRDKLDAENETTPAKPSDTSTKPSEATPIDNAKPSPAEIIKILPEGERFLKLCEEKGIPVHFDEKGEVHILMMKSQTIEAVMAMKVDEKSA